VSGWNGTAAVPNVVRLVSLLLVPRVPDGVVSWRNKRCQVGMALPLFLGVKRGFVSVHAQDGCAAALRFYLRGVRYGSAHPCMRQLIDLRPDFSCRGRPPWLYCPRGGPPWLLVQVV